MSGRTISAPPRSYSSGCRSWLKTTTSCPARIHSRASARVYTFEPVPPSRYPCQKRILTARIFTTSRPNRPRTCLVPGTRHVRSGRLRLRQGRGSRVPGDRDQCPGPARRPPGAPLPPPLDGTGLLLRGRRDGAGGDRLRGDRDLGLGKRDRDRPCRAALRARDADARRRRLGRSPASPVGDAHVRPRSDLIEISGSASEIGIVLAAQLFARATLMLVGGVWADRLPRQWVMLTSDLVRGASQSLGAVLLLTGHAEVWHLAVLAAVHGGAAAFFVPASTGLVPDTVSAARLQQANALMVLSRNALGIAGPAISGLLVGAFGAGWVYAIDAVSFAASASFLARLPTVRDEEPRQSRRFLADLAAGWRELTARTWLWTSIAYFSVFNVAFASFFVLGHWSVSATSAARRR